MIHHLQHHQTTYTLYIRAGNGGTVTFNANAVTATIVLMEIAG
jgi:hypothetical protein